MLQAFLKIRIKQFYRELIELGLFRIIFLTGLLGFALLILFMLTSNIPNAYYASGVYLLIIALIHIKRKDKNFLKGRFNNYQLIYFAEYFLLLIPIITCLLYHFQWMLVGSILFTTGVIVNIDSKPKYRNQNTRVLQLIPHDCFEWKAGIRKTLFLVIAFWVIGLGTSFYIGSVPIVIFILGIIPLSFYEKGEPLQMVLAYEMNTIRFLLHKIKRQTLLFTTLAAPLIVGFLIFHFEQWYIVVIEYLIFLSLHLYVILTKYAFYEPNKKSSAAQIFNAFGAFGLIIPVFIPVIWLLSVRFYLKSQTKLNFYLNDYN